MTRSCLKSNTKEVETLFVRGGSVLTANAGQQLRVKLHFISEVMKFRRHTVITMKVNDEPVVSSLKTPAFQQVC